MHYRGVLLAVSLVLVISLIACVTSPEKAIPIQTPATSTSAPVSAFLITSLDVEPPVAVIGQRVTITVMVKNISSKEDNYTVTLTVDRIIADVKEVTVAPESSKTVTFFVVKDTPGTYEIAVGQLTYVLTVREELELKYDDGEADMFSAHEGGGYSVRFKPPIIPFKITKVKVVAQLYGTEHTGKKAVIEIWDQNFDVLYSHEIPATEFTKEGGWVTIETNITVYDIFRVVLFIKGVTQEGGISIGVDKDDINRGSEVVTLDRSIGQWYKRWESRYYPSASSNWMIRVIGTLAKILAP